jgi:hypothetical protein
MKAPITSHELPLDAKGSDDPAGDLEEKNRRTGRFTGVGLRFFSRRTHSSKSRAKKFLRLGMGSLAY